MTGSNDNAGLAAMGAIETRAKPTDARQKPAQIRTAYETDLYTWSLEQAALLRQGRLGEIDALLVAGELDDVGSAEYDKLESALTVLLQHMLKWDYQQERRSSSWAITIAEQRERVERQFQKNPGLKSRRDEAVEDSFKFGRLRASRDTKLGVSVFPATCEYSWLDIMEREFRYEVAPPRRRR